MKKTSIHFLAGTVAIWFFVFFMTLLILSIGLFHTRSNMLPLRGSVDNGVSSSASSEPSASLQELLKKFFGINSSNSSAATNPDPTNDCNNTPNPFPGQCIAGQERCCKGRWICPNVFGQYVCE